jgi:2-phosphosulfolactate phosphatase
LPTDRRHSSTDDAIACEADRVRARLVGVRQLREEATDVVVVVDVLRAFTVAPWVLARGAASLTLAANDAEALALKAQRDDRALAIKDGVLTEGFDRGRRSSTTG